MYLNADTDIDTDIPSGLTVTLDVFKWTLNHLWVFPKSRLTVTLDVFKCKLSYC